MTDTDASAHADLVEANPNVERLVSLLLARVTLFWVITNEERRVERQIAAGVAAEGFQPIYWDCSTGAEDVEGTTVDLSPIGAPRAAFDRIADRDRSEVWIMRDLPESLRDAVTVRALKSTCRALEDETDQALQAAIVVLSTGAPPPPTLDGIGSVIRWGLPSEATLAEVLRDSIQVNPDAALDGEFDEVVRAAKGLRADDAAAAFSLSIVDTGEISAAHVAAMKQEIIAREPTLQWYPPEPRGLDAIGGLGRLKRWMVRAKDSLTPEAARYGLQPPKGVMIVGVQGCGKSMAAKSAPAGLGNLPLVRLDLGACKAGIVGRSEAAIRRAIETAEAVAPCVLWIDELDKALAGAGTRGDSGVTADQLGVLLTWQSERTSPVFLVCTANNVDELMSTAPELLRAGRFDALFFVDLPNAQEREEIFATTLVGLGRHGDFDLARLASKTEQFSGAEIRRAIEEAMLEAFRERHAPNEIDLEDPAWVACGCAAFDCDAESLEDAIAAAPEGSTVPSPLTTQHIENALKEIVPLAIAASERIDELRQWAGTRAVPASFPPDTTPDGTNVLGAGQGRAARRRRATAATSDEVAN